MLKKLYTYNKVHVLPRKTHYNFFQIKSKFIKEVKGWRLLCLSFTSANDIYKDGQVIVYGGNECI